MRADAMNCDCKILLSHPTGNANVRHALLALHEREMLAAFYTTVAWETDSRWSRSLPARLTRELNRRSYAQIPRRLIHTAPLRELCRVLLCKTGMSALADTLGSPFSAAAVYRDADRWVAQSLARAECSAVYAYDGGALETFRTARERGLKTMYELPTAHTRFKAEFFREEMELQPEFAATFPKALADAEWLRRKDEELQLADEVIVPSKYVQSTLPLSVRPERVKVIPYGSPAWGGGPLLRRRERDGKLRVLFVGNLTQGKGLSYLLEAIHKVESMVDFTIIGTRVGACKSVDQALRRYRWLNSLPHELVLEEMGRHDVLAFPTLSEGLALVVLEAMSRGMAVITTPNSGAVGILRDGLDGFLVPIRSAQAVAEKLQVLDADRELLRAMQESVQWRAREYTWARYRELLSWTVQELFHLRTVVDKRA